MITLISNKYYIKKQRICDVFPYMDKPLKQMWWFVYRLANNEYIGHYRTKQEAINTLEIT